MSLMSLSLRYCYLFDGIALGTVREADHVLWAADAQEREAWLDGKVSGERRLTALRWPLYEYGDKRRFFAVTCLAQQQVTILYECDDWITPLDNTVRHEQVYVITARPECLQQPQIYTIPDTRLPHMIRAKSTVTPWVWRRAKPIREAVKLCGSCFRWPARGVGAVDLIERDNNSRVWRVRCSSKHWPSCKQRHTTRGKHSIHTTTNNSKQRKAQEITRIETWWEACAPFIQPQTTVNRERSTRDEQERHDTRHALHSSNHRQRQTERAREMNRRHAARHALH